MAQFCLNVHKSGLKPNSFHLAYFYTFFLNSCFLQYKVLSRSVTENLPGTVHFLIRK